MQSLPYTVFLPHISIFVLPPAVVLQSLVISSLYVAACL